MDWSSVTARIEGVRRRRPASSARVFEAGADATRWARACGLICLVMGVWIAYESLRKFTMVPAAAQAERSSLAVSLPNPLSVPPGVLAALQGRILFRARNPIVSDARLRPTAEELVKNLQLRSTTQLAGHWVAYVHVKGEGLRRVSVGDRVVEFTVAEIEHRTLVLKLATETVTLRF